MSGKGAFSLQPETAAEANAWFQKAAIDLRGANIDLVANPQQASLLKPRQLDNILEKVSAFLRIGIGIGLIPFPVWLIPPVPQVRKVLGPR